MTLSPPAAPPAPTRRAAVASTKINASAGKRAGAYLLDFLFVAVPAVLVWVFTGSLPLVAVTVVELWAIGWIWEGHTGATPGNLICGIRTVRRDSLLSVGAPGLFLRSLLLGVSHVIPVLLPVSLAASGALDGIARARVVDLGAVRGGTAPGPGGAPELQTRMTRSDAGIEPPADAGVISRTPLQERRTVALPMPPQTTPDAGVAAPAAVAASDTSYSGPTGPGTLPVFELSDGAVIRATGLGFIGRAPRAPESIPDAILVRVPDGARSLSRTHASFGVEDGELWVQDLGSANGAAVRHLGGTVTELAPHRPHFLTPGDVLILGGDAELAFRRVMDRSAASAPRPAPSAPAEVAPNAAPAPATPPPATVADAVAPPVPATPGLSAATVALRFQDGTVVPILGTGYIGRAPTLPEGERADAALIAVPDGDRSVSRTHGRFGIVGTQTWFEDLGSGNGSALRTGDGRSGPMTPHQRFSLVPGMVLQLGDCIIQVVDI